MLDALLSLCLGNHEGLSMDLSSKQDPEGCLLRVEATKQTKKPILISRASLEARSCLGRCTCLDGDTTWESSLHVLDGTQEGVQKLALGGLCALEHKVLCGLDGVEERVVLITRRGQDEDIVRRLQMGHGGV